MKNNEKKPSICNCLNLRRAASAITKIYDEKLGPSGLTVSQYSILKHLKFFGPISVSDLAIKIRLDRTTLVRSFKPLEAASLIIDVSQKGTRNRQLQLTQKGIEKYIEAKYLWNDAQNFIEQELGKENIEKLTSLLSVIERLGS
ncbi:Transcriptional regulator, MarR family [Dehalobacter sp. UNSWDHB]|jgi:Transcriptional regulators|uniref:MarR family winged helix-turn-helix transcriptional regulator n=1 Tax=unclassified Dehalobacter TaxID=2635733 RepID=UPI00028A9F8B|nr:MULTISPECIES: MarR family transcriptional regulator [unclassified Dehalobacter]AFV01926.1 Transcriptional regulator, MarR family [Dehalobacter sp. DCA]AFV04961.1 Transcriptional regulator, MarR family [Dehalobacter sp. CF]EQB22084.1 Transcriptional regulator, MarR family [Dehalobacter sp. UNSWDHB]